MVGFSPLMHRHEGGGSHGDNNWVVCMLVVQLARFLLLHVHPHVDEGGVLHGMVCLIACLVGSRWWCRVSGWFVLAGRCVGVVGPGAPGALGQCRRSSMHGGRAATQA